MPTINLPSNTLFDIKYREQYVSQALNRKSFKIDPMGIYQGFLLVFSPGQLPPQDYIYLYGESGYSIAVVESNGVNVKVQLDTTIEIGGSNLLNSLNPDLYGGLYNIWLVVNYIVGSPTTGYLEIKSYTEPKPNNSICVGSFRVGKVNGINKFVEVFPHHTAGVSANGSNGASFIYQGASNSYQRDLMTKHNLLQNYMFAEGLQGWETSGNVRLNWIAEADKINKYDGVIIPNDGTLLSDFINIASNTNVYLMMAVKNLDESSTFGGDIYLGYVLYDINKNQIGNPILKKVAVNGQYTNSAGYCYLSFLDKISNTNIKFIKYDIQNLSTKDIVVNYTYLVVPYDFNNIFDTANDDYLYDVIPNQFQFEDYSKKNSTGNIDKEDTPSGFFVVGYKQGSDVSYDTTNKQLNLTIGAGGGRVTIKNNSKLMMRPTKNPVMFLDMELYSDNYLETQASVTIKVNFYQNFLDTSPAYTWQPIYNNGANQVPFNKIFNGQSTTRFQAVIDRRNISEDTFSKYGFYDLEIVVDNNNTSNVNLTIKSLKLLTADSNSGFGYFTDIVVKGLVDSNHKIQSGNIFTNRGVFIENSGIEDNIGTFITDGDKGLKLIISDNNNGYISRRLVKSDYFGFPNPHWADTDVIDCDTNQGVAGYFDYLRIQDNGILEIKSGAKLYAGGSSYGKINIDGVDHDNTGFADKLKADPYNRFTSSDDTIQKQIYDLADRKRICPVIYLGNAGDDTTFGQRVFTYRIYDGSLKVSPIFSFIVPTFPSGVYIRHFDLPTLRFTVDNEILSDGYLQLKFTEELGNHIEINVLNLAIGRSGGQIVTVLSISITALINFLNLYQGKYMKVEWQIYSPNPIPGNYDIYLRGAWIDSYQTEAPNYFVYY
jgi:hypothetical protein